MLEEIALGLHSQHCHKNRSLFGQQYIRCPHFNRLLLLNLLCRINYVLLLHNQHWFPELPKTTRFKRLRRHLSLWLPTVLPLTLVAFIFMVLLETYLNVIMLLSLNLLLLIMVRLMLLPFHERSPRFHQMKATLFFKLFMIVFFAATLLTFACDLSILISSEQSGRDDFAKSIQRGLVFQSLKRNAILKKKEWWVDGQTVSKDNQQRQALMIVVLVVISVLLRNWSRIVLPPKKRRPQSKSALKVVALLLFLVFFVLNLAYFVGFQYDFWLLKQMAFVQVVAFVFILNLVLRRFSQLGSTFKFNTVVWQEIVIYKELFFKNPRVSPLAGTPFANDFWCQQFQLLKDNYYKSFGSFLKHRLMAQLLVFLRLYVVLFCTYFFGEINLVFVFGMDHPNRHMLVVEMAILALAVVLLQVLRLVQSKRQNHIVTDPAVLQHELRGVALLEQFNSLVIACIHHNKPSDFLEQYQRLSLQLDQFMSTKFDLIVKTYDPQLFDHLTKVKIVLGFPSKFYSMEHSRLFVSKDTLGSATERGVFELDKLSTSGNDDLPEVSDTAPLRIGVHKSVIVDIQQSFYKSTLLHKNSMHVEADDAVGQSGGGHSQQTQTVHKTSTGSIDDQLRCLRRLIQTPHCFIFEEKRHAMQLWKHIRLKINDSVETKLRLWPQINFQLLSSIVFFSLFDFVKGSMLNLYLLSLTFNVNVLTPLVVVFLYGLPLVQKVRLSHTVNVMSVSFCIRCFVAFNYPPYLAHGSAFTLLRLANHDYLGFVVELASLSLSFTLLLPTFVLSAVVFHKFTTFTNPDYTKPPQDDTKLPQPPQPSAPSAQPKYWDGFHPTAPPDSPVCKINYFKWNRLSHSWLQSARECIIAHEKYVHPFLLATLSMFDQFYFVFFLLYLALTLFQLALGKDYFQLVINASYKSVNSLLVIKTAVFLFFLFLAVNSITQSVSGLSIKLTVVLVLLNFKAIFKELPFYKDDKPTIKRNRQFRTELVNFLENLHQNDTLIVRKTITEHNYTKFLAFHKYSQNSHFLSPLKLVRNNLMQLNYVFKQVVGFRRRLLDSLTMSLFENSRKFDAENVVFLGLLLREKFKGLVHWDMDLVAVLSGDFSSLEDLANRVHDLRNRIISNKPDVVRHQVSLLEQSVRVFLDHSNQHQFLFNPTHFATAAGPKKHTESSKASIPIEKDSVDFKSHSGHEPIFTPDIKSNLDLLQKVNAFYEQFPGFSETIENFGNKTARFAVDSQLTVVLSHFKYWGIVDSDDAIRITLASVFLYLFLFVKTYADHFLVIAYLAAMLMNYGHAFMPICSIAVFLLAIEVLPQFRLRRAVALLAITIASSLTRLLLSWNYLPRPDDSPPPPLLKALLLLFNNRIDLRVDCVLLVLSYLLVASSHSKVNRRHFVRNEFFGESCYRVT